MGIERRAHPRHELEVDIQFRGDGTKATTRDVSRGGCAILAPRMRLVNERIPLTLSHPSIADSLEVDADVRRAVEMPDGKWLLGVQFAVGDARLQTRVDAFIESLAGARAATEPKDAERTIKAAVEAEAAGNTGDAIKLLDRVLKDSPKRADLLVTRSRLAAKVGDAAGAVAFAKQATELEPDNEAYALLYKRTASRPAAQPGATPASSIFPPGWKPPAAPEKTLLKDPRVWLAIAAGGVVILWIAASLFE